MSNFEKIYQKYCVEPMQSFRPLLGEPVALNDEDYLKFLNDLKNSKNLMPDYSFYLVMDLKKQNIDFEFGMKRSIGIAPNNLKAFLQLIHPDYLSLF